MRKSANKALYLFLSAILGMVIFSMLHRSIFVLLDLLMYTDGGYAFGLSSTDFLYLDFFTALIALFLGGWYGTMMGMDWYAMVYGPNAEKPAGLFHSFLPHHWRGKRAKKNHAPAKLAVATPAAASTTVRVPVTETVKAPVREWSFDDLITPKPVVKKKPAARKSTTKKTTRKAVSKKVTNSDQTE